LSVIKNPVEPAAAAPISSAPTAPWEGTGRALHPFFADRWRGTASIVGGLAVWEFFSRVVVNNALFLAAPTQIIAATFRLAETGELEHHMAISGIEFIVGYCIASVLGIALGVGMAGSVAIKQMAQPWVSGLYATPTIALAPLFILWMGIGIWSKVIVVVTLVLFPVTINTEAGLRQTSERLAEMMRSFGASRQQIFWKLSLPSATPFVLAGLKLGIGRGLIGVVVAELFGSRAGLGRLISQSADSFNMPELFAGAVVLAIAGIVMTAGFGWLESRLVPWTKD
jgi:NitT/TauT family transport system permease protein